MIYLHQHNVLFFKPKKVAGTSLEILLSSISNSNTDIITPISGVDETLRDKNPQNYQNNGVKYYNHITQDEVEANSQIELSSVFKISVIRHPLDVAISYYCWLFKKDESPPDFSGWIIKNPSVLVLNRPFYFLNSKYNIDYMIRYENLTNDLNTLSHKYPIFSGMDSHIQKVKAKSNIRNQFNISINAENKQKIKKLFLELCDWEIANFGYDMKDIESCIKY